MGRRGLLLLATVVLSPAGSARAELPALAGTTVIEASSDTFVDVRLPEGVDGRVLLDRAFPPVAEGGRDYVRVELRRQGREPGVLGPAGFHFERVGARASRCPPAGAAH